MGLIDPEAAPDNGQLAYNYFVNNGYAPHQAAGIVGNLQGESGQGLDPAAVARGDGRDGSDSVGIGQWNGTRAQALRTYADSKGTSPNDLNTQLEFLHSELRGSEAAANTRLMQAQTPEEAARAMLSYERPKDWNKPGSHPERAQYAAAVLQRYGQAPQAAPQAPLMGIPPSPLPILPAQQPQPQQAQASQSAPASFEQIPQVQAPPIIFAPRRSPDLSKLKAALGNGGNFFARG